MPRSARLIATVLVLASVLAAGAARAGADGCPAPCSGQSSSPPGLKLLFVQPQGVGGPVLAYDTRTGLVRFSLPPGRSSADGRWHVAATAFGTRTTLERFEVPSGRVVSVRRVPGRWSLAGVSPTGRWLALVRPGTAIAIVNALTGRIVHRVGLRGLWEVETVSADGRRLFLIQHLRAGSGARYLVRLYDLAAARLRSAPLRAKGEESFMTGLAWSGIGSPDGRWLLTLYLDTSRTSAFVHALDLRGSAPACIDLPSGRGGLESLKRYTLTLAPNGRTLFAANAALGVVAEIDLASRRVVRTARFAARGSLAAGARAATLSGTISRNGRTLYFSGGRDLWAYDAAYGVVRGPYPSEGRLVGYGYGPGDRRVYAVRTDGKMLAFDAATGRRLSR